MISTHILDTNLGKPAHNVKVKLIDVQSKTILGEELTNQDGRIQQFVTQALPQGHYQLTYEIEPYFLEKNLTTFFPQVCIQFYIADSTQHYHIPLLISPYAYSTYRGS